MDDQEATPTEPVVTGNTILDEDRIDEFAIQAYQSMGYTERLSDEMVALYLAVKSMKDKVQPGRMSHEGLAIVAVLAGLADGTVKLGPEPSEE